MCKGKNPWESRYLRDLQGGGGDVENNQRKSSGLVLGKQEEKRGGTQGGKNLEERKWSNRLGCGRVVRTDSNRKVDT